MVLYRMFPITKTTLELVSVWMERGCDRWNDCVTKLAKYKSGEVVRPYNHINTHKTPFFQRYYQWKSVL
jgi:hypothetical protein